jgi:hypothetical protein
VADGLTPEEQASLNALTAEEIRQKQELGKLNAEELAYLQKRMGFDEKDLSALNERVVAAGKLLELYKKQAEQQGENSVTAIVAGEQEIELNDRKIKELEKKAKLTKEEGGVTIKFAEDEIKKLEIINGKIKRKTELQSKFNARQSESEQIAQDFGKSLVQSANVYGTSFTPDKITGFVKGIQGGIGSLAALSSALTDFSLMMIGNMMEIIKQAFDTEAAFIKATGATDQMARSMTNVYESARITGVSMEQVSAAGQALFGTYTDFTMLSDDMHESLTETASVLGQMGVANADFAKGIQISTKMLGQTAEQAEATSRELVTFARELGVAPAEMAARFAEAGPAMAKYGAQGVKAFKDLAHVSKITGMEISKVLSITDRFDTFEGAAEQAGQLNAALGGNFVNAMDLMMTTDPAERFNMLRDSILDAGLSFDDMSYYQKNFYKDSLGLADVGDLAMMLSGDMSNLAGATNESAESLIEQKQAAAAMQDMGTQLKSLLASMVPIIKPLIDALQALMGFIMDNAEIIKILVAVALIWTQTLPAVIVGVIMLMDHLGILNPLLEGIGMVFGVIGAAVMYAIDPIISLVNWFAELIRESETLQKVMKVIGVVLGVVAVAVLAIQFPIVGVVLAIVGLLAIGRALLTWLSKFKIVQLYISYMKGLAAVFIWLAKVALGNLIFGFKLLMLPLYATGKVIVWLAKVALGNLIFGFKLLMVPFLLTIILFKKLWSLLTPVGATIMSFGEKLLWLVKFPFNLLKGAFGWIMEKASPVIGFFKGVGDAVKSIVDPIMEGVKWISNLADVLFEKAFASTFLEGLGKVAEAFGLMKGPLMLLMEPFRLIKGVIDSVGGAIGSIISGVEAMATAIPMLTAALGTAVVESMDALLASMEARLPKIVSTINDLSIVKAAAMTATMVAGAAAGTVAGVVGGGGAAETAAPAASPAAQTVRQPIHLVIDGEPLKKYILEIIGTDIKEVNFG